MTMRLKVQWAAPNPELPTHKGVAMLAERAIYLRVVLGEYSEWQWETRRPGGGPVSNGFALSLPSAKARAIRAAAKELRRAV